MAQPHTLRAAPPFPRTPTTPSHNLRGLLLPPHHHLWGQSTLPPTSPLPEQVWLTRICQAEQGIWKQRKGKTNESALLAGPQNFSQTDRTEDTTVPPQNKRPWLDLLVKTCNNPQAKRGQWQPEPARRKRRTYKAQCKQKAKKTETAPGTV